MAEAKRLKAAKRREYDAAAAELAELERWNAALDVVSGMFPADDRDDLATRTRVLAHLQGHYESRAFWPRWPGALVRFMTHCPADYRRDAVVALQGRDIDGEPVWSDRWVLSLDRLRCRIPPDVSPEAMRAVASVYRDRPKGDVSGDVACVACGMRRPCASHPPKDQWEKYRRPDYVPGTWKQGDPPIFNFPQFFHSCPHCGEREWVWESLVDNHDYPWKALAEKEMAEAVKV